MELFDEFIADVLEKEGGYVNDPRDSGGETNYGITKAVARRHGYEGAMKSLPLSVAKDIYKERYWDSLRLDEIERACPSLALKLADISVNMGVGRAGTFLQRSLNVLNNRGQHYPDIPVDGAVGAVTIRTLKRFLSKRQSDGELVMVRALNCLQGAFYIELAERREKDEAFVYGWLLNRIS